MYYYAKKHHEMLTGNLRELDSFSKSKKNNVLKALIALSKYLGVYEQFKAKKANYGITWENQGSLQAFLRIKNTRPGLVDWVKACMDVLGNDYATFIRFKASSGLRKTEAIKAFNMIIELNRESRLSEYYNSELQSLEHFKFESDFIRGTKNAFFSFVDKQFIEQIAKCRPISYSTLRKRLKPHGLKLRLNELRDYYATFMVHNGVIKEETDLLQGRIGRSIFMRHYFSPAIEGLRDRVLKATRELETQIFN